MAEPTPRAAFAALPQRADLVITERAGLGLATIMARKNVGAAEIGARLGIAPPDRPARIATENFALVGLGPGVWLAAQEDAPPLWAGALAERLVGLASVSDQSSGYAVLRLSGPAARDLLSRGAFIDLHRDAFGPGAAATSVIAHMGIILWALDDGFEIALFRSYAASFTHWIEAAAAGLGLGASAHAGA